MMAASRLKTLGLLLGLVFIAALASLPAWANQGIVFVTGLALIEAVFALSWNLMFGFTGLVSFGHAAFFAIGAYLSAVGLLKAATVPFPALLAAAALLGAFVAWLVGLVCLRRTSGIYLAILTLALSEVLRVVVGYSTMLGREDGLAAIPRPSLNLLILHVDLSSGAAYYWFILIMALVISGLLWLVAHGPLGRALLTVRQDPERARFLGTDVAAMRLTAFTISGGVAALAGALYAPWAQIVTPDTGHWIHSTQPMLAALLGGTRSFYGPIVGTALFGLINYGTRTMIGLSEIVIGVILLLVVLAAPDGLIGLGRQLLQRTARPVARPAPQLTAMSGDV